MFSNPVFHDNLDDLSLALPDDYSGKAYSKWSYRTEEDLLFGEINKCQELKLNNEVNLLKKLNEVSFSLLSDKISDLENQKDIFGNLVNQFKVKATQAEEQATQAEEQATQAEALATQAEALATQAEARASQAEARASQAEARVSQAEALATQAEENAKATEELIEKSKELLSEAIVKQEHFAAELNHIKSRVYGDSKSVFSTRVIFFLNFSKNGKDTR